MLQSRSNLGHRRLRQVARSRLELAAHLHLIEQGLAAHHNLVLPRQTRLLQHDFFNLGGENIHAPDDQHIVAAPNNLAHAPKCAGSRGQQASQVAGAVAHHGQSLFAQRGKHQFSLAAVGQHLAAQGVDHLGVEVVLPNHRSVLGFDAFARHARPHHLGQAVDVHRVEAGPGLDIAAHRLGPGFSTKNTDFERCCGRV